ncbi:MAG: lysophospholipid acyltransferase family protein [Gammaproteobacteria bacterium]|nr:lysophospholipid acyltransferase family protein [Gammaproteobacteria bacterium]MCK5262449.1 lysophospholipid acyltransferase family protein [Gammaproteobacteria bacterium]
MISSTISHNAPASGLIKYWLGRFFMAILGWEVTGELPPDKKFVLIGAPHTSSWDLPIGLALTYIFRLKVRWLGKDTLFFWPTGALMRALGGIAVDRSNPHGVVGQMADALKQSDQLVIMLAPSGTRKKAPHWKSGFYHIAHQANVPIVCGYLDYKNKEAHLGCSFTPSGDIKRDMEKVREYYKDIHAEHPEKTTPVILAEES